MHDNYGFTYSSMYTGNYDREHEVQQVNEGRECILKTIYVIFLTVNAILFVNVFIFIFCFYFFRCLPITVFPPCKVVTGPANAEFPKCCADIQCPKSK